MQSRFVVFSPSPGKKHFGERRRGGVCVWEGDSASVTVCKHCLSDFRAEKSRHEKPKFLTNSTSLSRCRAFSRHRAHQRLSIVSTRWKNWKRQTWETKISQPTQRTSLSRCRACQRLSGPVDRIAVELRRAWLKVQKPNVKVIGTRHKGPSYDSAVDQK